MGINFEVKTLEMAGLHSVLSALHLPFGGEKKSESRSRAQIYPNEKLDTTLSYGADCALCDKDLNLIRTLVKNGDEHAKVLRGMMVWAEISAPRMIWSELDTYRIGTEKLASGSTMHTIGRGGLTINNFDVDERIKEILNYRKPEAKINPLHFDEVPEGERRCAVIEKFGRKYEVWNTGEIYSLPYTTDDKMPDGTIRRRQYEKKRLKFGKARNQQGYYQVRIGGKDGHTQSVHRIIAEALVPNPNNYPVVNHKDGDKSNCSPSNLEWCTSQENCIHAIKTGLHTTTLHKRYLLYKAGKKYERDIVNEWKELFAQGKTLKDIAEIYDANVPTIWAKIHDYAEYGTSEYTKLFEECEYYEDTINRINELSALYEDNGNDVETLIEIKRILPESFMQTRVVMFSYQALRRIYFQRRNHRLPHWHRFCDWIETLPFAGEWITIEKK